MKMLLIFITLWFSFNAWKKQSQVTNYWPSIVIFVQKLYEKNPGLEDQSHLRGSV